LAIFSIPASSGFSLTFFALVNEVLVFTDTSLVCLTFVPTFPPITRNSPVIVSMTREFPFPKVSSARASLGNQLLQQCRVEARPLTPIRCNDHGGLEVSLPQFGVEVIDGWQLERDILPGEVPHGGVALDAGFLLVHDGHRFFILQSIGDILGQISRQRGRQPRSCRRRPRIPRGLRCRPRSVR